MTVTVEIDDLEETTAEGNRIMKSQMKILLITTVVLASVSTAQAGLKGSNRAEFIQACMATNTSGRYSAQAALNYCNCGAQNVEQGRKLPFQPSSPLVVYCKAKYLK